MSIHFHFISLECILQLPLSVAEALASPFWHYVAGWSGKSPLLSGPPVPYLDNKGWTKPSLSSPGLMFILFNSKKWALGTMTFWVLPKQHRISILTQSRLETHEQPVSLTLDLAFLLPAACWSEGPTRRLLPERDPHHILHLYHRGEQTTCKR